MPRPHRFRQTTPQAQQTSKYFSRPRFPPHLSLPLTLSTSSPPSRQPRTLSTSPSSLRLQISRPTVPQPRPPRPPPRTPPPLLHPQPSLLLLLLPPLTSPNKPPAPLQPVSATPAFRASLSTRRSRSVTHSCPQQRRASG